jgi:hypothetical protein
MEAQRAVRAGRVDAVEVAEALHEGDGSALAACDAPLRARSPSRTRTPNTALVSDAS